MNAVRPMRMDERAVTFRAWFNSVPVTADWEHDTAEAYLRHAVTADEAIAAITPFAGPKCFVSVLEDDAGRNRKIVRFYRIQKSTTKGWWRDALDGGRKVWEGALVAKPIDAMQVNAYEPTPPFRVTRETTHVEIVGIDRTLVEQRA